jgi:hypothetical protein
MTSENIMSTMRSSGFRYLRLTASSLHHPCEALWGAPSALTMIEHDGPIEEVVVINVTAVEGLLKSLSQ